MAFDRGPPLISYQPIMDGPHHLSWNGFDSVEIEPGFGETYDIKEYLEDSEKNDTLMMRKRTQTWTREATRLTNRGKFPVIEKSKNPKRGCHHTAMLRVEGTLIGTLIPTTKRRKRSMGSERLLLPSRC